MKRLYCWRKRSLMIAFCFLMMMILHAQYRIDDTLPVQMDAGEKWFGAAVNAGDLMPFAEGYTLDLYGDAKGNQAAPLLYQLAANMSGALILLLSALSITSLLFSVIRNRNTLRKRVQRLQRLIRL